MKTHTKQDFDIQMVVPKIIYKGSMAVAAFALGGYAITGRVVTTRENWKPTIGELAIGIHYYTFVSIHFLIS